MSTILPNPLVDDELPPTPPRTPEQVATEARQFATVGWVRELFEGHPLNCPAIRSLAKWRLWFACGFGACSVAIVTAGMVIKSQNETIALRLEARIVKVVREELSARTARMPATETTTAVATSPRPSPSPTFGSAVLQFIPSAQAAGNP